MVRLPTIKLPSPGRVYIPGPHAPRISGRLRWRFVNKGHRIRNAMLVWQRTFLRRAGGSIRTYAITSFRRRKNKDIHSPIGKPPFSHLRKSEFLRAAIMWAVSIPTGAAAGMGKVLVGAYKPVAGFWGQKHEHGGYFGRDKNTGKKAYFPNRPFMKPAFRRWQRFGLPKILKDTGIRAHGLR